MALTLLVTDNGDATATFTVAGSSGSGTVVASWFRGREGQQTAYSTVWSFSGDGSSSATAMTPGHYFFFAKEGANLSPLVYQSVQDPNDAQAVACRKAVSARIKLLALDGIWNNVVLQFKPNDLAVSYPVVFVTLPEGGGETDTGGTNATTDWGHPVRVLIADRLDMQMDDQHGHFDMWRQQIRHAFDRQRLPGVTRVKLTRVEPGAMVQRFQVLNADGGQAYQLVGSELVIRCITRELQGFGE